MGPTFARSFAQERCRKIRYRTRRQGLPFRGNHAPQMVALDGGALHDENVTLSPDQRVSRRADRQYPASRAGPTTSL